MTNYKQKFIDEIKDMSICELRDYLKHMESQPVAQTDEGRPSSQGYAETSRVFAEAYDIVATRIEGLE